MNNRHIVQGKLLFCSVKISNFTEVQGIGREPLYQRYSSLEPVIQQDIQEDCRAFFAEPLRSDSDTLDLYFEEWQEFPTKLVDLVGTKRQHYEDIKVKTIAHYRSVIEQLVSTSLDKAQILASALKFIDDDFIYCYDDKVVLSVWGMRFDDKQHLPKGEIVHYHVEPKRFQLSYETDGKGIIKNRIFDNYVVEEGRILTEIDIPELIPNEGYVFRAWEPEPQGLKVEQAITFRALYDKVEEEPMPTPIPIPTPSSGPEIEPEPETYNCYFDAGESGDIKGENLLYKDYGSYIQASELPEVNPKKGYRFKSWDRDPLQEEITGDVSYTAQYEKILPWYQRLWTWFNTLGLWSIFRDKHWLRNNPWLKWLLYALLILFLLWLFAWLFRDCSCRDHYNSVDDTSSTILSPPTDNGSNDANTGDVDNSNSGANEVREPNVIDRGDGRVIEDNGRVISIIDDGGRLPNRTIVAPIQGYDGREPEIITLPPEQGGARLIANRLNIYFEDDNADMQSWVEDFKKAYPDEAYSVIGSDPNVRMIQIQIPENKRDQIRTNLPSLLPNHKFFVIDEMLFQSRGEISTSQTANRGWHLSAIGVKMAWQISQGSPDVIVAVVDDGIDATHNMFPQGFYKPYNVFTQDNRLGIGSGHGTHVAALAVGASQYYDDGASGIAPNCKLMPVQVFDNGSATFSSIASGVMYALHNGATVINLSVGPDLPDAENLSIAEQERLAQVLFKDQERVWNKIARLAEKRNAVLVFAAGNEHLLACLYPENRDQNTLNVAAVNSDFKQAKFSNFGKGSNISAPGEDIYSAYPRNSFKMMNGTSMATPIVTGAVALIKSVKPSMTCQEIKTLLRETGRPVNGNMPPVLQIDKALAKISGQTITEDSNDNEDALRKRLEELKHQRQIIDDSIQQIKQQLQN